MNVPVCAAVVLLGRSQIKANGPLRLPDRAWVVESALLGAATIALMLGLSFTTAIEVFNSPHDTGRSVIVLVAPVSRAGGAWRRSR